MPSSTSNVSLTDAGWTLIADGTATDPDTDCMMQVRSGREGAYIQVVEDATDPDPGAGDTDGIVLFPGHTFSASVSSTQLVYARAVSGSAVVAVIIGS